MDKRARWGLVAASGVALAACGGKVVVDGLGTGGGGGGGGASPTTGSSTSGGTPTGTGSGSSTGSSGVSTGSSGVSTGSSGVSTGSSGSSGSGTGSGSGSSGGPPPVGQAVTFAISKLFLGDTNWDGTPNKASGWKQYGMNVDGKVSTTSSVDLCKPASGASPKSAYPDGNDGIDNSWGKNILPIELAIDAEATIKVAQALASGGPTTLIQLVNLGNGPNQGGVGARVLLSDSLGHPPKYDGTDAFPVSDVSLADPNDVGSAKYFFSSGALSNNHWVSSPGATIVVRVPLLFATAPLELRAARIEVDLTDAHDGMVHGILGGVLATTAVVEMIKTQAGSFDPSLCGGPTIDSISAQVEQASDILADGSQSTGATCSGISIGLGFEARVVEVGAVVSVPVPPDPCGP